MSNTGKLMSESLIKTKREKINFNRQKEHVLLVWNVKLKNLWRKDWKSFLPLILFVVMQLYSLNAKYKSYALSRAISNTILQKEDEIEKL